MDDMDFNYIQSFLLKRSGLVLNSDKKYLLDTRLQPLARKHALADIKALIQAVRRDENGTLALAVIDAMTTNETLFFRDQYPYEALKTLIFPELHMKKGMRGPIKIWSAASSRGQEAVSIAISAIESMPNAEKHVRILGTDLSKEALAYAKAGVYTQMEVQRGMPVKQLIRFFQQDGVNWRLTSELKHMLHFESANLVADGVVHQAKAKGPFDIVFLRNVLIYFSVDERKRVIDRVARCMNPGGYLITGAAEIVEGIQSRWESVMFKGKRLWKLES